MKEKGKFARCRLVYILKSSSDGAQRWISRKKEEEKLMKKLLEHKKREELDSCRWSGLYSGRAGEWLRQSRAHFSTIKRWKTEK